MQWEIMHRAFGQRRRDARAHRRPEAGHLRLPWCRRARLPRGPPGGAVGVDPRRQLAQRRGAARGLRRAVRRRAARRGRHHLPQRSAPPTPTASPGSSVRRSPRRCGCVSCTPTTVSCPLTAQEGPAPGGRGAGLRRPGPRRGSRRAPPARPEVITRRRDGSEETGARCTRATSPCWCATNSHAADRAERPDQGGRAGRHRWFRLGVRDRAGPGLAPPARGARTADGAGPGVAGRADLLRRLDTGEGGDGGRGASGRTSTGRCTSGRPCLRDRGVASLYETVSSAHDVPGPGAGAPLGRARS